MLKQLLAALRSGERIDKAFADFEKMLEHAEWMFCEANRVLRREIDADEVRDALAFVDDRAIVEVSGGITLERVATLGALGVDVISVGALTHSSPSRDLGLDWS